MSMWHRVVSVVIAATLGCGAFGTTVRVASSASGKIVFDSDSYRTGERLFQLYIMNADGSHLTHIATPVGAEGPAFSPDGHKIAFFRYPAPSGAELYIMNVDGTGLTRLITFPGIIVFSLAFSPDGRRIAFGASLDFIGPVQIYVMDADGSHLTPLTNLPGESLSPAFSPDGRQIAFAHAEPAPQTTPAGQVDVQIYIMSADGSHVKRLTNRPGGAVSPTFGPNGRIAFVSGPGDADQIYTMNVDGSNLTRLPTPAALSGAIASLKFSPDGGQIAFSYFDYQDVTPTPSWQIYVMDTDGSHLTRLTDLNRPEKHDRGRAHNLSFGP